MSVQPRITKLAPSVAAACPPCSRGNCKDCQRGKCPCYRGSHEPAKRLVLKEIKTEAKVTAEDLVQLTAAAFANNPKQRKRRK